MATIFILTFAATFLIFLAVLSMPLASKLRVRKSLSHLSAYGVPVVEGLSGDESTFTDRVIWPFLARIGDFASRWTDSRRMEKIRNNLALAGVRSIGAEKFTSVKLALAAAGFLNYLLLFFPWLVLTGRPVWLALPIIALGYFAPDFWLQRRIEKRQKQIGALLADSIDILTIGMEAGLAFDSALTKVAKNADGPLSEEFGRVLGEMQVGVSRSEALRKLADRTTVPELQNFCATLIQADALGVSITKVLRTETAEIRTRRRQAAEEQAMKTPVKLVFPIVLCILPALLIVILGPAVIRVAGVLLTAW